MRRSSSLVLGLALVATACSGVADGPAQQEAAAQGPQLAAEVASYDIAAGEDRRFIVGLLTDRNEFVSGGTATMRFFFLPEDEEPQLYREAPARFLAVPGEEPGHDHAKAGPASQGRGVYAVESIEFDRPGFWQVEVEVEVDGEARTATAAFQVGRRGLVPGVGDEALATQNLTLDSRAPTGAIDSRGEADGEVPDPELHRTTIAAALEAGRPAVVVFSTPVYCVSRFCGPITEMVAELAADYGDRAEFIHIEIWRDFQGKVVNQAAADWLLREGDLREPWVFFIDANGIIRGRWDNVATRGEIEPFLRDLPKSG